jgi:hypothetical protein
VRGSGESGDEPPSQPSGSEQEPGRAASASGFFARLDTVNLAELIQLHCQRQVRAVFRVTSRSVAGHLFFDRGKVCHATLGSATGLDAVASMLALGSGVFESATEPWPTRSNLGMEASALLLALLPASADEKTVEIPAFDARMHAGRGKPRAQARLPLAERERFDASRPIENPSLPRGDGRLHTTYFGLHEGRQDRSREDAGLRDAAAGVHELCGSLGHNLGLGACFAIELGDAERVLLIFEPEPKHLHAGIGDRVDLASLLETPAPAAALGWAEAEAARLDAGLLALSALQDQPGVIGGLIGSKSGLLLASSLPGPISQRAVAEATGQLARLFRFRPELQLQASGCEMTFAAHRLAAAAGSGGVVAVLGLASAQAHELHLAARGIARLLPAAAPSQVAEAFEFDGELTPAFLRLLPQEP